MRLREKASFDRVLGSLLMMAFLVDLAMFTMPVQALAPKTFVVSPSGGDDTANIQGAFDEAVAAGPGSVVRLMAGYFHCNNIFVENFRGTFEGAGKDLTVIDTLLGLDPSFPGLLRTIEEDYMVFFCGFKDGDIRISDMTFDITAHGPAEPWVYPFP